MAGRIVTLQRQARELGRLRAGQVGTTVKNGRTITFPKASHTWILTSAQRDYLDVAADLWGGQVEEWQPQGNGPKQWRVITETAAVDAILPPGDPISQANEMWSRGGCQRRCTGERELLGDQPCVCLAQFGDSYHEQPQGKVCDIHTRLNVILPDLPDIGVWRAETKGYWAANRITACVDLIKGQVGPAALIPVRLRIEPKTRVKGGQTSQFTEIVCEIRGGFTFGKMLAGQVPDLGIEGAPTHLAIGAGNGAPAIEAAPQVDDRAVNYAAFMTQIAEAADMAALRPLWTNAKQAGVLDDAMAAAWTAKGEQFKTAEQPVAPTAQEPAPEPVEGEPDDVQVWNELLRLAGGKGWNTPQLEQRYRDVMGHDPIDGTGSQLDEFRRQLVSGAIA